MPEIETKNIEEFFTDGVAVILANSPVGSGGSCAIRLFGDQEGAWTIDFSKRKVYTGILDNVDFYWEMDTDDFLAMLDAKLDVPKAIDDGRIRFEGDQEMLITLSNVLGNVK